MTTSPLPDLSKASAAPRSTLRALGQRLTALGLAPQAAAPVVHAVRGIAPALRHPAEVFYARRLEGPAGVALRMFMFHDPVTLDEARAAFGELLGELLAIGLVAETPRGVASPYALALFDDLFILSDIPGAGRDAVMGFAETTVVLSRAIFPKAPLKKVLDLGCGAGTCALILARAAQTVIGTDISARAVELSRVNAAINGIEHAEFRVGDRYEPVAGEAFDLICSQPPFVAEPEGTSKSAALYGGARGDELPLSMIAELPRHLTRGGRAVFVVEWPNEKTAQGTTPREIDERIRGAIGAAPNLLVLRAPPSNLVAQAVSYAAALRPELGPEFEADAMSRLTNFERQGIRELTPTLVIVQRSAEAQGPGGYTITVPIESLTSVGITSGRIEKLLAGNALIRRGADAVLDARARLPEGTVLAQTQVGPGADVPSALEARFADHVGVRPIDLTVELLLLLTMLHEAETVRAAIPRCMEMLEVTEEVARMKLLQAVVEGVQYGGLEIEKPGA